MEDLEEQRRTGEIVEERKKGRPKNIIRLGRERTGSYGDIMEMLGGKRKGREQEEEEGEGEEAEAFKKSKVVERTPGKREKGEETDEMVRKLGERMDQIMIREYGRIEEKIDELIKEARKEREDMKKQWEEERDRMRCRIEELEKKVEGMEKEKKDRVERGGRVGEIGKRAESTEKRIRMVEHRLERKDREERRKNIVIKGVKMVGGEWEKEIERIWRKIGVEGGRKRTMKIGGADSGGRGMVLIELEGLEKKKEIMKAKVKLRGEKERIEDDLTQEERRIKWLVEREAERERATGKRVKIGYGKIWVEGRMRVWNEEEGKCVEAEGNV